MKAPYVPPDYTAVNDDEASKLLMFTFTDEDTCV